MSVFDPKRKFAETSVHPFPVVVRPGQHVLPEIRTKLGSLLLCIECQIGSVGFGEVAKQKFLAQTMIEQNVADKSKRQELWSFLFLTVIFAPALAAAMVGGYGFLVWMYQLVQGPPAY